VPLSRIKRQKEGINQKDNQVKRVEEEDMDDEYEPDYIDEAQ
jgi:hypothetical protein